jgi:TPR repeat protein
MLKTELDYTFAVSGTAGATAHYFLGYLYDQGFGVEQDLTKAFSLVRYAAQQEWTTD